ncbi:MAG TPA: SPOR domain-containing protein [Terriglobales bacterium]|nr:SPOR domain-containing protein [Terriglobales bacterium]
MSKSSEDTEITLGTGKMLALFFGLVALCAVFFGMGFSMGKNSFKSTAGEASVITSSTNAIRPQAAKTTPANTSPDMTFYKAVGQKDADTQLAASTSVSKGNEASEQAPPTEDKSNASDPMVPPAINGYYVQVAAVSKQDDAEALVSALKGKQYPAFSASIAGDKLFHVQVGPFADIKEAESLRAKLVSDGYNPIVKK